MKRILFILSTLVSTVSYSNMTSSITSGNWNTNSTWDTNIIPLGSPIDTVCITASDIVNISVNITYTNSLVIIINGTLFLNSSMLTLPTGSSIIINDGGLIDSNNNGTGRLNIGSASWGGIKNDPIVGPISLVDTNIALSILIDTSIVIDLDNGEDKEISFYPNPITDMLYFNINKEDIVSLYFYTSNGSNIRYDLIKIEDNLVKVNLLDDFTLRIIFIITTQAQIKSGSLIVIK